MILISLRMRVVSIVCPAHVQHMTWIYVVSRDCQGEDKQSEADQQQHQVVQYEAEDLEEAGDLPRRYVLNVCWTHLLDW